MILVYHSFYMLSCSATTSTSDSSIAIATSSTVEELVSNKRSDFVTVEVVWLQQTGQYSKLISPPQAEAPG